MVRLILCTFLLVAGAVTGFAQVSLEAEMARFHGMWQSFSAGRNEVLLLMGDSYIFTREPLEFGQINRVGERPRTPRPEVDKGRWRIEVFVETTKPSVVRFNKLHFSSYDGEKKWSLGVWCRQGNALSRVRRGVLHEGHQFAMHMTNWHRNERLYKHLCWRGPVSRPHDEYLRRRREQADARRN